MSTSTVFPARHPGVCKGCGEFIRVDDPIKMVDGIGAVHDNCDDHVPMIERSENPICDKCWLTHPVGACDR